jgi:uncharacterized iron-regulated membrane protein
MNLQLPLHSGNIVGLGGRILISLSGLVTAMLSITGVVIWLRKRRAAVLGESNQAVRSAPAAGSVCAS